MLCQQLDEASFTSAYIDAPNTVALSKDGSCDREWLIPAHSAHAELLLFEKDDTAAQCKIFTVKQPAAFHQISKKWVSLHLNVEHGHNTSDKLKVKKMYVHNIKEV